MNKPLILLYLLMALILLTVDLTNTYSIIAVAFAAAGFWVGRITSKR